MSPKMDHVKNDIFLCGLCARRLPSCGGADGPGHGDRGSHRVERGADPAAPGIAVKSSLAIAALIPVALLVGCREGGSGVEDSGIGSPCDGALTFADLDLERAVLDAVGKEEGPVCPEDVVDLEVLDTSSFDYYIIDLSGIEQLTALVDLDLSFNVISDIGPLADLTSLERLSLHNNHISDISPLSSLTSLVALDLNVNQEISDLGPLGGLAELEELRLYWNDVSDLAPLEDLIELRHLDIGLNDVADIGPLGDLAALEELRIIQNDVADLGPVAGLESLRVLSASGNPVSDLGPLAGHPALVDLHLFDCSVDDISPLSSLLQLQLLSLGYNEITDLAPLVANPGMGEGDTVYLEANPIDLEDQAENIEALEARGVNLVFESML